jgi:hypothetical protein
MMHKRFVIIDATAVRMTAGQQLHAARLLLALALQQQSLPGQALKHPVRSAYRFV